MSGLIPDIRTFGVFYKSEKKNTTLKKYKIKKWLNVKVITKKHSLLYTDNKNNNYFDKIEIFDVIASFWKFFQNLRLSILNDF